ncbi:hypothetical protein W97_01569 [Coniosporium apollinis CBS 100218]|uniref:SAM-dependent MTase RsmB/NOP-type domain-containing protein n=1 Tax=Coniosporium apollinis (strain CBS 100218) TaxID=1168221 RepID=R7YKD6_CONA1|nr:uncharacterized protein W97_01569 [Coniosporium apollinis CBS 100218]EON62348.1 hypothetical protein W97_01569 [Coniosporium apollinis CBS 100218]
MSLYYEAAAILANADNTGGSLKSRIYGKKGLKSSPAHLYALISETTKWSAVLKEVVEKSGILKEERKLTPLLALLLSHDLLLAKGGVAAPKDHVLKQAILRHKARLSAEFTKARLKAGFHTAEAFREHINAGSSISNASGEHDGDQTTEPEHPRWIRINTIKTTLETELRTTFADYQQMDSLASVMRAPSTSRRLRLDAHIPDLIALPPRADLSKHRAYLNGNIIFQDKASCFPAYLLSPSVDDCDVIDACAAPGNKTTHLAAVITASAASQEAQPSSHRRILAFERDKRRAITLAKMITLAGADSLVTVKGGKDFLTVDPSAHDYCSVGALLLDPSCSGSGIVGRDDGPTLHLPSTAAANPCTAPSSRPKKRKRKAPPVPKAADETPAPFSTTDAEVEENPLFGSSENTKARLESLSSFQLKLLKHAMSFPAARKISYSTCSIHAEENEHVVLSALQHSAAVGLGWRILRREEQVDGMRRWPVRGDVQAVEALPGGKWSGELAETVREACIRCEKGTGEGTMGFFVAGFVRDGEGGPPAVREAANGDQGAAGGTSNVEGEDEEEWEGFSDGG